MWYNELLFVLMFVALIGMGVMVLVVKVNMRKNSGPIEKKAEAPEKKHEPENKMRAEPIRIVSEPVPEPEPVETIEISEALFKPIFIQAVEPEPTPEPTIKPADPPTVEEAFEPVIEPTVDESPEPVVESLTETINELIIEPQVSQIPEPQATQTKPRQEEETRRLTDTPFFDLRYEYNSQSIPMESPTILDEAPSIDPEEEKKEERPQGIVTCPHCKSEVPQTLYCIYCGNTLTAKPHSAGK